MARLVLNAKLIESVTSDGKPQKDYFDVLCPGLSLRVSKHGKKAWSFLFAMPGDGKTRRMALGTYPAIKLVEARELAEGARRKVHLGLDPREVDTPSIKTIQQLWDEYWLMHVQTLRSGKDVKRVFDRDVLPLVGKVPVKEFRISDLNRVVDPIRLRGKASQAALTFRLIRGLINFALERGELEHSPIARAREPKGGAPRERFLTVSEVVTVWNALPGVFADSTHVSDILRLCLITGQRLSEIAGMQRGEIDLTKQVWTIPKDRVKNGQVHAVPLTPLALEIVGDAMRETNSEFLFPDTSGEQPLGHRVIDRALARAQTARPEMAQGKFGIPRWMPHDLRRTFSTLASMAENGLRLADTYADYVLNHRSATKNTVRKRHYNANAFLDEKRAALLEWDAFLARLVAGDGAAMKMAAE